MSSSEREKRKVGTGYEVQAAALVHVASRVGRFVDRVVQVEPIPGVDVVEVVRICRERFSESPSFIREQVGSLVRHELLAPCGDVGLALSHPGARVTLSDSGLNRARDFDPDVGYGRGVATWVRANVEEGFASGFLIEPSIESDCEGLVAEASRKSFLAPMLLLLEGYDRWSIPAMARALTRLKAEGRIMVKGSSVEVPTKTVWSSARTLAGLVPGMIAESEKGRNFVASAWERGELEWWEGGERVPRAEVRDIVLTRFEVAHDKRE